MIVICYGVSSDGVIIRIIDVDTIITIAGYGIPRDNIKVRRTINGDPIRVFYNGVPRYSIIRRTIKVDTTIAARNFVSGDGVKL